MGSRRGCIPLSLIFSLQDGIVKKFYVPNFVEIDQVVPEIYGFA